MQRSLPTSGLRLISMVSLAAALAIAPGQAVHADYPPSLEELEELVLLMQDSVAIDPPQGEITALAESIDATSPVNVVSEVILGMELLEDPATELKPEALMHLESARDASEEGLVRYAAGNLVGTVGAFQLAAQGLQAVAPSPRDPLHATVNRLSLDLAMIAQRIAGSQVLALQRGSSPILEEAQHRLNVGDTLLGDGQYVAAIAQFGGVTDFASRGIGFDIDLFEQNIRNTLAGETIGYAYTIGRGGLLYSQDGVGDARSPNEMNNPNTSQSPFKEMYIASVTKTISAVALLIALDEKGISVDAGIANYLPADWDKGDGVKPNDNDVTFRHLLTHTSGLTEKGQLLDDLKDTIKMGTPGLLAGPADPVVLGRTCLASYTNANYSLMRVLIPQITLGQGAIDNYLNVMPEDLLYAALYSQYVIDRVLEPAGINVSGCSPFDSTDTRTLYYSMLSPNSKGDNLGNWSLRCGATGWYLSSNELGSLLAFLRHTDDIADDQIRDLMDEGYLGWLNPCDFSDYVNGDHGIYRAHGGDSIKGTGPGMSGCMMNYRAFDLPIQVEASLLINSRAGDYDGNGSIDNVDHPCWVLKVAFDQAWQ